MKLSEAKRQVMLQQWTELIKEQKASGMKVNAWCKERGIDERLCRKLTLYSTNAPIMKGDTI